MSRTQPNNNKARTAPAQAKATEEPDAVVQAPELPTDADPAPAEEPVATGDETPAGDVVEPTVPAEPTDTPPEPTIEVSTAYDAAVASWRANNPDADPEE